MRGAIVGVGASAGGLDAFKRFFSAMPAESGLAFVLIPHLDPAHPSYMVELLTKHTRMPVVEAKEGMTVEPDSVYVIPPNQYLAIRERGLRLSKPMPARALTAIDPFFESLAEDQREKAIGIILSGTGSHGTLGLREIKLAGGMVMAQSPDSAAYDQMPRNAVATGLVDYVLPPEQMPAALHRYAQHPYLNGSTTHSSEASRMLARIVSLLQNRARFDLRCYRKRILQRRIQRRMGLHQLEDYSSYLKLLRESPEEMNALCADLLVKVTGFLREPEAFEVLSRKVIAELAGRATAETPVRVWVPGCGTGEEAYSVAILLLEAFHALSKRPHLQLFATDLSRASIQVARQGIYSLSVASNVGPERLERFFVRLDEDHYQVTKGLRESCIFAVQNVTADAPFSKLDLISCRNLLIFLEPETQSMLARLFHFALKPNGYLFLGATESLPQPAELFDPISRKWRIYRRAGPVQSERAVLVFPDGQRAAAPPPAEPARNRTRWMERQLLAEHTPAAVLVDESFWTHGYYGYLGNYLQIPPGEPTRDLLAMSRPGLRSTLRTAIRRAAREKAKVEATECRVKREGKFMPCVVTVSPVQEAQGPPLYLVTFREDRVRRGREAKALAESALVKQLELDLKATREDLESTIEQLETSNEELRTSNEEVSSMNKELQSANEELETSEEELRSMNAELTIVNAQLQEKVGQLERLHDDLINLMNSTEIAVLFLDPDAKIKRFSPAATRLLDLLPSDLGRPLRHLPLPFADETLFEDVRQVTESLVPMEKDVPSGDGRFYLRRILPYRASDPRVSGTIITLVEISARKRAEAALADLNAALERRVRERTAELESAQAELARSHETLRSLWARLLSAEDLERRRISRELHDDFSQRLAMLSVDIESLTGTEGLTDAISGRLQRMTETAAVLSEDVRQLAYSLHPSILDHLGLSAALRRYADEFSSLHGISVTFRERGIHGKIDPAVASCFYRVAQEALTNVARHSRSPRSIVHLVATPRAFRLSVMDFGDGFDVLLTRKRIKTLGLVSMEERVRLLGGVLTIRSTPGRGTLLRATRPRAPANME